MSEAVESELEERGVSTARVMTVHQRAVVAGTDDELLTIAKGRAVDPEIFTEYPPLFLGGEISSTRWDAYDTSMHPTTLQNFAREAGDGVAVLRNHSTYTDPIGHSLTGRFIAAGGNGVARVESDFFILPDPETEAYARKLRAGIVRDQSVGFHGGIWRCTLCKKDMMRWGYGMKDSCPHLLGVHYTPQDQAGEQKGEAQKARAIIEDAHLAEYSTVYDGATPGAMLKKARSLAQDGQLSDQQRDTVQRRYKTHLPDRRRQFPGVRLGETQGATMDIAIIEDGGVRFGERFLSPADLGALDQQARTVRQILVDAKLGPTEDPAVAVRNLAADVTKLRAVEAEVLTSREGEETATQTLTRLRKLADEGRSYRDDLTEQALEEGVRAFGADFQREQEKADLAGAGLETVKRRLGQWKAVADKALPKGRQTVDSQEAPAKSEVALPAAAFR